MRFVGWSRPVLVAVLLVSVAGCGGEQKSPTSEATKGPAQAKRYSTIDELVKAGKAAGLDCPALNTPVRQRIAADSRYCSDVPDGDVEGYPDFSLYVTASDLEKARLEAVDMAKLDKQTGLGRPDSALVGPNWIILAPLDGLQKAVPKLGGTLQNLDNVAVD
jgi:hypothetical protein